MAKKTIVPEVVPPVLTSEPPVPEVVPPVLTSEPPVPEVVPPVLTSEPPVPEVVETLYIGVNFDDEITEQLPTLAAQCRFLHFTSAPSTQSMEAWQRLFEANRFRFVRDTMEPTTRSQLYQSLHQ